MGTSTFVVISVILLAARTECETSSGLPPIKMGLISGTVREAQTRQPLEKVSIIIDVSSGAGDKEITVETNSDGSYKSPSLPFGLYTVVAASHVVSRTRSAHLSESRPVATLEFSLPIPGSLGGTVRNGSDHPLSGIQIALLDRQYRFGIINYAAINQTITDAKGRYEFREVKPNHPYLLYAFPARQRLEGSTPSSKELQSHNVLRPVFYPNVIHVGEASVVEVTGGEARNDLDLNLIEAPSFCFSATLDSAFRANAQARIFPADLANGFAGFKLGVIDEKKNGVIATCGLTPGDYRLIVYRPAGDAGDGFFNTAAFTIDRAHVLNLPLRPEARRTLTGSVIWRSGTAHGESVSNVTISLSLLAGFAIGGLDGSNSVQTTIPGDFTISDRRVDAYAVKVRGLPQGNYVEAITFGGTDVLKQGFDLGAQNAGLQITVAADGGRAVVNVVNANGDHISDATVKIISANEQTESLAAESLQTGTTDDQGRYTSPYLKPGIYHAAVVDELLDNSPEAINKIMGLLSKSPDIIVPAKGDAQATLVIQ